MPLNALPIYEALPRLLEALAQQPNVVLQAPPGAGKSTGVPLALLDTPWLGDKKILMLEPRRLAARAVAARMASQLNEPLGQTVGYRTRLDSKVSRQTRIEVITEGILTRRLQNDAALEDTAIVIFDEFHERSLQADLGLALCLDVQSQLREDLKILVMSATLDGEALSRLMSNAPIVSSAGKSFPVETIYKGRVQRSGDVDIARSAATAVLAALNAQPGDILVFLPGQGEIRRTQRLLEESTLPKSTHIFPLFGELSPTDQDAAIQPSSIGRRKIVLATNIAETSLTIEGVTVVIDSGLARRSRFDPNSGMSRLDTVRISRASSDQRRGRAGRLAPGVCYRLWTETEQASLAAHTPPEMMEADLAPLALELAAWGALNSKDATNALRWLDPPPLATLDQARELLFELQAIDAVGKITPHGRAMATLGAHPRLAHMLLRSQDLGLVELASHLAALLGERDIVRFRFDAARPNARNVDIRIRLDALIGESHLPTDVEVDRGARQRALRSAELFQRQLANRSGKQQHSDDDIGALLAFAFPDRIAQARGSGGRYLLSGGRGAMLVDSASLQSEFLVVAELDDGDRDARIRLAAPLARATLEHHFADRIINADRVAWDERENAVISAQEKRLGALLIESRKLEQVDADKLTQAMLDGVKQLTVAALAWTKDARTLQARMEFARKHDANASPAWPNVSDEHLSNSLNEWLAPWLNGISRKDHLTRLDMHAILLSLLNWNQQTRLEEIAPTHLLVPSGSRIPIDYDNDPPTLAVRLQEVFGLLETPRIASGRVSLLMQLLSPAHRPVQTTQDLASFWARGYHDVKKDLKGRYPKHYWPDDPLQAQATARAKPRPQS